MTVFESNTVINKTVGEIYAFLSAFQHHERLMPSDMVSNWVADNDTASFTFQNMAKLSLKVAERVENTRISIIPNQQVPFEIKMDWILSEEHSGTTKVQLKISAELNMMMKMMASGPLSKLANHQTTALSQVFI